MPLFSQYFYAAILTATLPVMLVTFTPASVEFPDSAAEENTGERAAWELLRLRDPATGKIPPHIRTLEVAFANTLPSREEMFGKSERTFAPPQWTNRGPWNVGGRTRAIAIDVGNTNVLLAGGVSGGIWRTSNGGTSWQKTTAPDALHSVTTIVQDVRSGKEHIWYAGTGELYGNSARISGDGILKSTNGGYSWFSLASTTTGTPQTWEGRFDYIWRLVVDPVAGQDVVLATTALGGIFRSSDGGQTWTSVLGNFGNNYSYFTDIAVSRTGVFYAAMSSIGGGAAGSAVKGIYRSVDGIQWENITPPFFPDSVGRVVIGIAPSNESQVWILAHTPGNGHVGRDFQQREDWNSLWKYNRTGNSGFWTDKSANLPTGGGTFGDFNAQNGYNLLVKVKPDDTNTVFVGGTNLYRSTDGFSSTLTTWIGGYEPGSSLPFYGQYPNQHPDQHDLIFYPNTPMYALSVHDGGISLTSNVSAAPVIWGSLNNGYLTTQFYTAAVGRQPGSEVIIGGLQDNGTHFVNSTNPTAPWASPGLGDGSFCAISDDGSYFMSRQQGRLGRFHLDSAGNVIRFRRIDPAWLTRNDYLFINPFILDPNDNRQLIVAGGKMLWRNSDVTAIPLENKWDSTAINWDSMPKTRLSAGLASALCMPYGKNGRLFYGTTDGRVFRLEHISDLNEEPVEITGTSFPKGAYVSCIASSPADDNTIIVSFSNYNVVSLFISTDAGATWQQTAGNLEQHPSGAGNGPGVFWVAAMPVEGKTAWFAATTTGLYSTYFPNGEKTVWVREGESNIGNIVVNMVATRAADGLVAAATHGLGMFSATVVKAPELPAVPALTYPPDNTRNRLDTIIVRWNPAAGAGLYTVQYSRSQDFSQLEGEFTIQGVSANFSKLSQGKTTYYWRVKSLGTSGESEYSPAWAFTTAVAPPELLEPVNGEKNVLSFSMLRWKAVINASSYRLQIGKGFSFNEMALDTLGTFPTEFRLPILAPSTRYSWRVASADADGEGLFSERFTFTTDATMSAESGEKPDSPNLTVSPDGRTAHITAGDNRAIRQATVYSITGLPVLQFRNEVQAQHEATLDISGLATGTYFVVVSGLRKNVLTMRIVR